METKAESFIGKCLSRIKPLLIAQAEAYWNATGTGKDRWFKKYADLQNDLQDVLSVKMDFNTVQELIKTGPDNPMINRQLGLLQRMYLPNQIPEKIRREIVAKSTEAEQLFSTFRAKIGSRMYSDNDLLEILQRENNPSIRQEAWEASKQVGEAAAGRVLQMVRMRNVAARMLGYDDFFTMSLTLSEQDPAELTGLLEEIDVRTKEPFEQVKEEIDSLLAEKCRIHSEEIMPWHYNDFYFQEAPPTAEPDIEPLYEGQDVLGLCERFYAGIGLPVGDVLARSDLYERDGKYQSAYCVDIDREGDVRVMANIKANARWMEVMLHELGHAVYDTYHDRSLPWLLREPAHVFTTEASAKFFERMVTNAPFLEKILRVGSAKSEKIYRTAQKVQRMQQLIFARWCLVVFNFEKAMYADPEQDLNALWRALVERNQCVSQPDGRDKPDWAAKIHVSLYPAYYQNYLLGDLLASQWKASINRQIAGEGEPFDITGRKEVGAYFMENVYYPGVRYHWQEMTKRSTGEKLSPECFFQEFL